MTARIDRRAARTRKALHDALMRLVLKKSYERITVQDIIDEADVGRSTFYAHFNGKDELLRGGFDNLRREMARTEADADSRGGTVSLALFAHAIRYEPVYGALVGGRGGALVDAEFRRVVAELVGGVTVRTAIADDLPSGLRGRFAVDCFLAVLGWAFDQKERPSPESLDEMFRRLLRSGLGPDHGRDL